MLLLGLIVACATATAAANALPGQDSWEQYTVSGLDVESVVAGDDETAYSRVVIMLHGGGGSGSDWYQGLKSPYRLGWFGNMTGFKYVFPTSALDGNVWYVSYKNGCGLDDDCAYDISSIEESASRVSDLIEHERLQPQIAGDASKVFLAGFSQGAQLTSYMQIAKLDYALGGCVVMDGYPLPPLCDMPGADPVSAKKNASYTGDDMKFMLWWGEEDTIFPVAESEASYGGVFEALGVEETLKVNHTEPGQYHTLIEAEFDRMVEFINTGE